MVLVAGGYEYAAPLNSVEAYNSKSFAILAINNLVQTYDGTAKSVSVTTTPLGLSVNLTYNGLANAPTNVGSYTVIGIINDPNYQGSATNLLVILNADIGLRAYDGTAIIKIACEGPNSTNSAVRFNKNGTNYGILLTATNSPNASKFRVQTSSGTKAIMKLP